MCVGWGVSEDTLSSSRQHRLEPSPRPRRHLQRERSAEKQSACWVCAWEGSFMQQLQHRLDRANRSGDCWKGGSEQTALLAGHQAPTTPGAGARHIQAHLRSAPGPGSPQLASLLRTMSSNSCTVSSSTQAQASCPPTHLRSVPGPGSQQTRARRRCPRPPPAAAARPLRFCR